MLPTTLAASESDGGLGVKMVFERTGTDCHFEA
jgi:hypothetical protein